MYKKIILKLSGESLGKQGQGISFKDVDRIIAEIKPLAGKGISLGIIVGGGNIWRGSEHGGNLIKSTDSDYVGMTATLINGLVLRSRFAKHKISAALFSSFPVGNYIEQFTLEKVAAAWKDKKIVIMVGGTGRPHFTTDTGAAVFAVETSSEVILKATDVDGVYDKDPNKDATARLIKRISFDEVIKRNLKVMDMSAFSICRHHGIKIVVFNFNKKGNILRAASGLSVGSLIL